MAFADFMTAMMAFFLVMWLSAQDKEILIATSKYFQNPFTSPYDAKSGVLDFESSKTTGHGGAQGSTTDKADKSGNTTVAQTIDLQFLNSVAKDVYRLLNLDQDLADKPVDVQVTSDGLRIILYDRASRPFFEARSPRLTTWGDFVLQGMAWMIERHGFLVVIEGHARPDPALDKPDYTTWELSADRANAARRALVRYAVEPELVERVTGYADTRPMPGMDPASEANQRVTISLRLGTEARRRLSDSALGETSPSPVSSSAPVFAPAPAPESPAPARPARP